MRIPDHIIDDVRAATDIVDVISGTVRLRKRGKNFLGLCPFHQEKTPSFTVSAEKQMYHCFGCGKGGNVFTFVMENEKISFAEAVRSLAERAGVSIPEEGRASGPAESEFERLYQLTRFAGRLFHEHMFETQEGKDALEYFHKRGFTDETIRGFGLGYSLNTWDSFVNRARQEGFTADELVKAGLARNREDGSLYDYFRGRAMFPILSTTNRVLGFGARKMREDDPIEGKYINSPETPIYNKSRVLFGLSHAREAIRQDDSVFMVEGYADLISLFQAGIRNVVASSGTALTEDQLRLIGRYTRNLTLMYDADSAGSNAMIRGIDLALAQDFDIRIVELPEGEDPDSFVQTHGGAAFRELARTGVSFIDFKAGKLKAQGLFNTAEGTTKAIRSIVESIAQVEDELKRTMFIKAVGEKYGVYENVLSRELGRIRGRRSRSDTPPAPAPAERAVPTADSTFPPRTGDIPPEERDLLKLLIEGQPNVVQFILGNISLADLSDVRVRTVAELVINMLEETGTVDSVALVSGLPDKSLKGLVSDLVMDRYELSPRWQQMEKEIDEAEPVGVARDAVRIIRRKAIRSAMEENQHHMRDAAQAGEDTMPLMQRQLDLLRMLKELEDSRNPADTKGTNAA